MEALSNELTTKLQFLEFKNTKTQETVQGGNVETTERHLNALRKLSREADDLKLKIEEKTSFKRRCTGRRDNLEQ